ncbi:ABC transporter permease [Roseovarius indicus]|uniref:ABC transporter permease n=1 Tax=Roseovarius indicus TaxID=540747 RepID=UPI0007D8CEEC|nr:ABC transporter permease [Roseovarius indicus]OAN98555.1 peptide ABC transporter permease [Roseovarius indicus]
MISYLIRRTGLSLVIVALVIVALFLMIHLIPGDPVSIALGPRATPEAEARFIEKMKLDQPIYVQLAAFFGNLLTGDLGRDIFTDRPVLDLVLAQLPNTVILAVASLGWAIVIGIPLGCFSAAHPNSAADRITGILSVGTIAVPSFVVSIYALLLLAIELRWFPVIGINDEPGLWAQLRFLTLPAFAVGLGWVGYLARFVRASMLEVLGENHVRAATAFGLPRRKIVYNYALRVAILPTITLIGVGFGGLLSGAVFAEIIFTRPGLGKLIFDMVEARNFPVVQGAVLITALLYVFALLATDVLAAFFDPRMRQKLS